jgi:amino acid transporter
MAPTSGGECLPKPTHPTYPDFKTDQYIFPGQYHWTSEFAPPQYQRVLSYASGWLSSLGLLSSVAAGNFISALQVQALVNVYLPDLAFTQWQTTLMMIALGVVTIILNTRTAPILPALEIASLYVHVLGFVVIAIVVLVLCPKNSPTDVFLTFTNTSGYDSMAAAILMSQVYVFWCIIGSDSVTHISEEVSDASINVPRSMWWSYVGNAISGFGMLIVLLFCVGPIEDVVGHIAFRF